MQLIEEEIKRDLFETFPNEAVTPAPKPKSVLADYSDGASDNWTPRALSKSLKGLYDSRPKPTQTNCLGVLKIANIHWDTKIEDVVGFFKTEKVKLFQLDSKFSYCSPLHGRGAHYDESQQWKIKNRLLC
jgi:hypothetical protein